MKKEHLAHFNIAGFTYYEGPLVFKHLTIGTKLQLQLDTENRYDPRAVMILFDNNRIGYVPRTDNRILYKLIQVGLGHCIECRIQRVSKDEHPENQVQVVVHLVGA